MLSGAFRHSSHHLCPQKGSRFRPRRESGLDPRQRLIDCRCHLSLVSTSLCLPSFAALSFCKQYRSKISTLTRLLLVLLDSPTVAPAPRLESSPLSPCRLPPTPPRPPRTPLQQLQPAPPTPLSPRPRPPPSLQPLPTRPPHRRSPRPLHLIPPRPLLRHPPLPRHPRQTPRLPRRHPAAPSRPLRPAQPRTSPVPHPARKVVRRAARPRRKSSFSLVRASPRRRPFRRYAH